VEFLYPLFRKKKKKIEGIKDPPISILICDCGRAVRLDLADTAGDDGTGGGDPAAIWYGFALGSPPCRESKASRGGSESGSSWPRVPAPLLYCLSLSLPRSRAPASALRSAALCASSQRDADRHAAAARSSSSSGTTDLTARAHRAVGGPPLRPRRIYVEYTAFITARGTR
jgi:hypothetical protein